MGDPTSLGSGISQQAIYLGQPRRDERISSPEALDSREPEPLGLRQPLCYKTLVIIHHARDFFVEARHRRIRQAPQNTVQEKQAAPENTPAYTDAVTSIEIDLNPLIVHVQFETPVYQTQRPRRRSGEQATKKRWPPYIFLCQKRPPRR
ncbi:hypothetical protein ALO90_200121 [Pseudomonas amygdali pv. aesculi]|nr:hypothetical protein ALO90_200121 [Pseudomonas amygdali pv. aesculi]